MLSSHLLLSLLEGFNKWLIIIKTINLFYFNYKWIIFIIKLSVSFHSPAHTSSFSPLSPLSLPLCSLIFLVYLSFLPSISLLPSLSISLSPPSFTHNISGAGSTSGWCPCSYSLVQVLIVLSISMSALSQFLRSCVSVFTTLHNLIMA